MKTKLIRSTVAACVIATSLLSTAKAEEKNILVLGNSYSFGTFNHLPGIAEALGDEANVLCLRGPFLEAIERELSGEPLIPMEEAEKLGHGESNEAGYVLVQSDTKKRALLAETLRTGNWDVVTMQSGSGFAQIVDTDDRYQKIADYVQQLAPDAEFMMYMTTQYRNDGLLYGTALKTGFIFRESRGADPEIPYTEDRHYLLAYKSHQELVNREGWRVIPGGTAFQNVRYAEGWPYEHPKADFDYANMTEADLEKLPREKNLRYGIAFPGKDLKHPAGLKWWVDDHPHTIGEYIVGLIYYEIIFGKSAVGCSYYPEDKLTADEALLLQKVVHETAQGRMPPLRLFSAEDIAYYNEVLAANPNSVVESVEADEEYNAMTLEIWEKFGKLRMRK